MKAAWGAHIYTYTARARTLRCACNRLTTLAARPSRPLHDEKVRAENNSLLFDYRIPIADEPDF
jgi:hypothetical protein